MHSARKPELAHTEKHNKAEEYAHSTRHPAYVCVCSVLGQEAIVALPVPAAATHWAAPRALGHFMDRMFKEDPQPLSAIGEHQHPDFGAKATANRCQWSSSSSTFCHTPRFGLQLN